MSHTSCYVLEMHLNYNFPLLPLASLVLSSPLPRLKSPTVLSFLPIPNLPTVAPVNLSTTQGLNKTFSCLFTRLYLILPRLQNLGGNAGRVTGNELTMGPDLPTV